ncbi:MAG: hypothetical protein IT204_06540 [Fimbriimonadaceae bacterium]|nr:hypothetical protein [Fimbriimonadaceae bacterium]
MSEPLKVAFVTEGVTDYDLLVEIVRGLLGEREFVPTAVQPERDLVRPERGEGWPAVRRWCSQTVEQTAGPVSGNPLLLWHDLLVVQLDADVAEQSYASGHLADAGDLPCAAPCPPASATTDALRAVLLRWLAEPQPPRRIVLCTPSKQIEAWVLAGLYPQDPVVRRGGLECRADPSATLGGKPLAGKLVASGRKRTEVYRQRAPELRQAWAEVCAVCTEAVRFEQEFRAALASIG